MQFETFCWVPDREISTNLHEPLTRQNPIVQALFGEKTTYIDQQKSDLLKMTFKQLALQVVGAPKEKWKINAV